MKKYSGYLVHILSVIGFVCVSLFYFYPVLQQKTIYQSDIVQYTGMSNEQNNFRESYNTEPYWTNSAFGGMPTYQLGAKYPHNYIKKLDSVLRFLPRPADYLFLYLLGFYILMISLRIKPLQAFIGALAFGFSTYLIIILGVGHNAKAHAIAYMPMVVAGVLLVFRKQYLIGGILTMVASALEIQANHFQMTYYLLFLLLFIAVFYAYKFIKAKDYSSLIRIFGIFLIAATLAIGANATNLLATKEYTNFSIRGKSELTFTENGAPKTENSALEKSYITEYSYGIAESLNLIAPRLFGGGNGEQLSEKSKVYETMIGYGASPEEAIMFTQQFGKTYWGNQPIVEAPAYIGAVVFFLFLIAMFNEKRKIKYVFLCAAIFSLLLSWGKNLMFLTDVFIDFVPFYDKFRAVSSIQVILELCLPILAIMGLHSFFSDEPNKRLDSLKKATAVAVVVLITLLLAKSIFSFASPIDEQLRAYFGQMQDKSFGNDFVRALQEDRKAMYNSDLLRSGIFILLSALALWLFVKNKLSEVYTTILIGLLLFLDLFFIAKNYVNAEDFVSKRQMEQPFEATVADNQIMQDTTHYRVLDIENYLNARASYFHKSLGGYSAVRPRKMQEVFDYQIVNNNSQMLNMLNVKYVIQPNDEGELTAKLNPMANGNAWFVNNIKTVSSADEEMRALNKLDTKSTAIINTKIFNINVPNKINDSIGKIYLKSYKPNELIYTSNSTTNALAVFSEIFYPNGWIATINGKPTQIINTNYLLRAIEVPKGNHTIVFTFKPQVVKTGSIISLISSLLMVLVIISSLIIYRKNRM